VTDRLNTRMFEVNKKTLTDITRVHGIFTHEHGREVNGCVFSSGVHMAVSTALQGTMLV